MTPADAPRARLHQLLGGYRTTQLIYVAAKLGISDALQDGPKGLEEIARIVHAHAPSLHRVLRALVSLGLYALDGDGRYRLTEMGDALRAAAPDSMRPFAVTYGDPWWWNAYGHLLHSVRTGETAFDHAHGQKLFEYLSANPEAGATFNANRMARTADESRSVVEAYDFSATRVLVDIGGGHGALAAAVLGANPKARAVLFDLPGVIEGSARRCAEMGIADRCKFVGGDFFDSVPGGGDTYVMKDILHDWNDADATAILRTCRRAMRAGTRLLVVDRLIGDETDPSATIAVDISMLVLTGGRERTEAEFRDLLAGAGFAFRRTIGTRAGTSIIEAEPRSEGPP